MTLVLEKPNTTRPETDAEQEYRRVSSLLADPFTRPEIDAAQGAMQDFRRTYPQWRGDFYHELYHDIDYLEQREREAQAMGLSQAEHEEREAFLKGLRGWDDPYQSNDGLETLIAKRARLLEWLKRHPDDPTAQSFLNTFDSDLETTFLFREPQDGEPVSDDNRQAMERIGEALGYGGEPWERVSEAINERLTRKIV